MKNRRSSLADALALAMQMGVPTACIGEAIQKILEDRVDHLIKRLLADDFYNNQNGFNGELRASSLKSIGLTFNAMITNLTVHDCDYSGVSAQTICCQILKRSKGLETINQESANELIQRRLKHLESHGSITKLPNGCYMMQLDIFYNKALMQASANTMREAILALA